ncbi:MAG: prevent-host-death protein [Nitrospinae bacterium CG11_big_fil_rev_8_21_14_0_20_56_8]|nr:MAG: prevent-host-death protein [Nitrospinae bacterium CG11_big_fil_rev_8_21_14_0_20_56_8]
MKTASVREVKAHLSQYLKAAEKEDILVTSHGKPRAVLRSLSGENLEDFIIENNPEIRKKVEEAYREYMEEGGVPLDRVMKKLEKKVAPKVRR